MKSDVCKQCGGPDKRVIRKNGQREAFAEFCSQSCYNKFKNKQPEQVKRNKTIQLWLREARPKTFILYRARSNAKARGIECLLNLKDIPDIPEFCPVFPWIRLDYQVGERRSDSSPSLDRIDNKQGYIVGNIRIVSHRANTLKSDATQQELVALASDASKQKT
jgi:hypothetical protein